MKKLSDVFWEAANIYLKTSINDTNKMRDLHSCDAVSDVCKEKSYGCDTVYHAFMIYLD